MIVTKKVNYHYLCQGGARMTEGDYRGIKNNFFPGKTYWQA